MEPSVRPFSVHQIHIGRISGTTAVHSVFPKFAGLSYPFVTVAERSYDPYPSMVRKGSPFEPGGGRLRVSGRMLGERRRERRVTR